MKRTFRVKAIRRIAVIIAIIAVIGFSMAACSDDGGSDPLVGTWYATQSAANSRTSSAVVYEFKSNGDLVVGNAVYIALTVRWTASGGRITTSALGFTGSCNYSISGSELRIWNEGDSALTDGTYYKPR